MHIKEFVTPFSQNLNKQNLIKADLFLNLLRSVTLIVELQ